jgi:4-amino-4-deoxychorismate mutase
MTRTFRIDGDADPAGLTTITTLREQLDQIDRQLLDTLRERIACCAQIAEVKRVDGVPMMQRHRIGLVHRNAGSYGAEHGMSQKFLRRLYEIIIDETCRIEELVISGVPHDHGFLDA